MAIHKPKNRVIKSPGLIKCLPFSLWSSFLVVCLLTEREPERSQALFLSLKIQGLSHQSLPGIGNKGKHCAHEVGRERNAERRESENRNESEREGRRIWLGSFSFLPLPPSPPSFLLSRTFPSSSLSYVSFSSLLLLLFLSFTSLSFFNFFRT